MWETMKRNQVAFIKRSMFDGWEFCVSVFLLAKNNQIKALMLSAAFILTHNVCAQM